MTVGVHGRRLAILVVPGLLSAFCATIDRKRSSFSVGADAEYSYVRSSEWGCGGDQHHTERGDHQIGAKVFARYEHRHGFLAEADIGLIHGRVNYFEDEYGTEYNPPEPGYDYWLGIFEARLGYDLLYFGGEVGIGAVFADRMQVENAVWPQAELRFGRLDLAWAELGIHPYGGVFDGRLYFLGAAYRHERFTLQGGFSSVVRWIGEPSSMEGHRLRIKEAIYGRSPLLGDPSGYVFASVLLTGDLRLRLGLIAGEAPSARLGLSYGF